MSTILTHPEFWVRWSEVLIAKNLLAIWRRFAYSTWGWAMQIHRGAKPKSPAASCIGEAADIEVNQVCWVVSSNQRVEPTAAKERARREPSCADGSRARR